MSDSQSQSQATAGSRLHYNADRRMHDVRGHCAARGGTDHFGSIPESV